MSYSHLAVNELEQRLRDPMWRIASGQLYKITIRDNDNDDESFVIPFVPNQAQLRFLNDLHYRNIILKARQLGFTTLIAIVWLDHALFNANQRCGIIAQDLDAAEVIFRDKIRFAYDNLPDVLRERFPLKSENKSELLFAHNNSSIRVGTSMRSGTIHRLHVSEFGKIGAKYPEKAKEVLTGSFPAVPKSGITIVESTAEGAEGDYFNMVQTALARQALGLPLTQRDYKLHFYGWWQDPTYRIDPSNVIITQRDHEYFDECEEMIIQTLGIDTEIDIEQRAWYISTRENDFNGEEQMMWQEYPSYPEEAFKVSTEGNFYIKEINQARRENRITQVPTLDAPVNTFWDIGNHDGCGVWFHQEFQGQDRFIHYYEAHGEDLRHYVHYLKSLGYVFGTHYLPHDADHRRLGEMNRTTREMLEDLMPSERFEVIPRISELSAGIHHVRQYIKNAWFDMTGCELGIRRLSNYRKVYSRISKRYTDTPDKSNGCSECADAFRQWAQAKDLGFIKSGSNSYGSNDYKYQPAEADWRV